MPDRRDTARGRAAPTTPPMRPPRKDDTAPAPRECSRRQSREDNAVPANSANVPAAPPLLHTLRQCACRPRTIQFPRLENAAADRRPRTTPFPPTPTMRPPRRRSCAPSGNAPAAPAAQGQCRSRQLRQCDRRFCVPSGNATAASAYPPAMRPLRLPPKDNAVPANSAHATTAPPLLRIPANAPAAQGRYGSRAQRMQPQTVTRGQRRSRQLRQCARRPRTTPSPRAVR